MDLSRKITFVVEVFVVITAIYVLSSFTGCTKQRVFDKDSAVLGNNLVVIDGLIYEKDIDIPFEGRIIDTVKSKIIEYDVVNGKKNGQFIIHYENGTVQIEGFMKDNKNEGEWKYFYPSGKIESKGIFKDDKVSDKWTWYYENGKIRETGIFVDGKREGKWNVYDQSGDLNAILIFRDGKMINKMTSEESKYI